jgi:S-adenosylmethionine:tRNA ribosyltransferase-isomerase
VETAAFDYDLPEARIAQQPIEPRDAARLLVDRGSDRAPDHLTVADLPDLLAPGDLVVVNDTRVLASRLRLRKATGGAAEVMLLEPVAPGDGAWTALVRPGRRLPAGTLLYADSQGGTDPVVEVGDASVDDGDGVRRVRVLGDADEVMSRLGELPLPPYITGRLDDPERYQTVYSARPASVAAPTAGLHLTDEVLGRCRRQGVEVAKVELVVGVGTFRPIATDAVEGHTMHAETYRVAEATMDACDRAARVIAIGTTTVRALESAAASGELSGRTELFIRRPYEFAVVDRLLTNFHLPRSSLLVMIDAFIGPRWRGLYVGALAEGYRFLSFGDAMLLDRS